MSRLSKIFLLLIFLLPTFYFLLPTSQPISAQTPTPTPAATGQGNPISDFVNSLIAALTGAGVDEGTKYFVESSLPPSIIQYASGNSTESGKIAQQLTVLGEQVLPAQQNVIEETSFRYGISKSLKTPEQSSTNQQDFFAQLVKSITDILGITKVGDEEAKKFASTQFSKDVVDNLAFDSNATSGLAATDNLNVLGLLSSDAMTKAFPLVRCANLPPIKGCGAKEIAAITQVTPYLTPGYGPTPTEIPLPPAGNYVYYSQRQRNPPYAAYNWDGSGCTVNYGGCGPVTVAMILSTYVSNIYNPIKVIDDFYPNQAACLSSMTQALTILSQIGSFTVQRRLFYYATPIPATSAMIADMRNHLQAGQKLIANAVINGIGHFFWITNIDSVDNIYVMDSWYQHNIVTDSAFSIPFNQKDYRCYSRGRQIPCSILYRTVYAFSRTTGR